MWGPDVFEMPASSALFQMTIAFSAVGAFGYLIYKNKLERPVAKRSYPFDGLKEELGGIEACKVSLLFDLGGYKDTCGVASKEKPSLYSGRPQANAESLEGDE